MTNPDTWTLQLPATDGFYWLRDYPHTGPRVGTARIVDGWVYLIGTEDAFKLEEMGECWWVGPLRPPAF